MSTPKIPPPWAQAIRDRRELLGKLNGNKITQEDIAARTGDALSQRTVSHLEKGTIHVASLAFGRVIALASALDWTLLEFQHAIGMRTSPETSVETQDSERIIKIPDGLDKAVKDFGERYPDLTKPEWQQYLSKIKWKDGEPIDSGRWLDIYRDLVRNGIEP